jgi:uncharacterized membrane protein
MKNTTVRRLAPLLFGLVLTTPLFAAHYRYTRIDVPNGSQTVLLGINARGDILGRYDSSGGVTHGFLLRNGTYSNIDYPGEGSVSPRGINARGDIVGRLDDAQGTHGFLLIDGQFTPIDFPGASSTAAFGINNSGDISGQYVTATGEVKGFLLRNGIFQTVHVPAGTTLGVYSSEDNGRVLVGDVILDSDSSIRGYIRTKPGHFHLIVPPGSNFPCAHARGINESGDISGAFAIVGTVDECNNIPPTHGFILRDGRYTRIDPPGSHDTFVQGINDDGVVVGIINDSNGNSHGFKAVPED